MSTVEERAEAMSAELRLLMEWEQTESEKIIAQLKAEGKIIGLDGYPERFAYIRQERNRRLRTILEKYKDLPPDTEFYILPRK